jgi:hypothetical protein
MSSPTHNAGNAPPDHLDIDLGAHATSGAPIPFRVRIDASAVRALIDHAREAHRIYELWLLRRPGDIWRYVTATLLSGPGGVVGIVEGQLDKHAAAPRSADDLELPEGALPFTDFDKLFNSAYESEEDAHAAWERLRYTGEAQAFAMAHFEAARRAWQDLDEQDPLVHAAKSRIEAGTHPFDRLSVRDAIAAGRGWPPRPPLNPPPFYAQVARLLDDPGIRVVSYCGHGDYHLLRMLCAEQIRRAEAQGVHPDEAFEIHTLKTTTERGGINPAAWGGYIRVHDEGFGLPDIYIEDNNPPFVASVALSPARRRIKSILVPGPLDGAEDFDHEVGEGWHLYRRKKTDLPSATDRPVPNGSIEWDE